MSASYSVDDLANIAKTNKGYREAVKDYLGTTGRYQDQQVGQKRKLQHKWDKSANGKFDTFNSFAGLFACIADTNEDIWNEMPMVSSRGRPHACMRLCFVSDINTHFAARRVHGDQRQEGHKEGGQGV